MIDQCKALIRVKIVPTSMSFLKIAILFRQFAYREDVVSSPGQMILFVPFHTLSVKVVL